MGRSPVIGTQEAKAGGSREASLIYILSSRIARKLHGETLSQCTPTLPPPYYNSNNKPLQSFSSPFLLRFPLSAVLWRPSFPIPFPNFPVTVRAAIQPKSLIWLILISCSENSVCALLESLLSLQVFPDLYFFKLGKHDFRIGFDNSSV